jgi:dihydrofolate synthase/folylpolyglutamate synthase
MPLSLRGDGPRKLAPGARRPRLQNSVPLALCVTPPLELSKWAVTHYFCTMRNHDPQLEGRFFKLADEYLNLEANTGRKYTDAEYNLDGIRRLAKVLGHPEKAFNIIHVAGTKGKGSTAAMIAAMLHASGERVGVFSSPHLATVRERFMVNGELIEYDELLGTTRQVKDAIETADLVPTFFEFITVLALELFRLRKCRWAVLETGIGGLLDCTNFIDNPACCVITPVSFDHTELLGSTIREIAEQKAGIIKPRCPVVVSPQPHSETLKVVKAVAESKAAPLHVAKFANFESLALPYAPAEPFQRENLATALTACEVLGIPFPAPAFKLPRLPGRCECVRANPLVVLDAAHNADSARRLTEALVARYPDVRFTTVLGISKGKDAEGILLALRPIAAHFIFTDPRPFKATGRGELIAAAERLGIKYEDKTPIHEASDLPADTPLLFTGSFFTAVIGEEIFGDRSPCGARSPLR